MGLAVRGLVVGVDLAVVAEIAAAIKARIGVGDFAPRPVRGTPMR